jgi:hypothetical protein
MTAKALLSPLVATQIAFGLLLITVVLSTDMYVRVMYQSPTFAMLTSGWVEAYLEGLYFAVQTVTTVGYGNWQLGNPDTAASVTTMRRWAIPTMLAGVFFFSLLISGLSSLLIITAQQGQRDR